MFFINQDQLSTWTPKAKKLAIMLIIIILIIFFYKTCFSELILISKKKSTDKFDILTIILSFISVVVGILSTFRVIYHLGHSDNEKKLD